MVCHVLKITVSENWEIHFKNKSLLWRVWNLTNQILWRTERRCITLRYVFNNLRNWANQYDSVFLRSYQNYTMSNNSDTLTYFYLITSKTLNLVVICLLDFFRCFCFICIYNFWLRPHIEGHIMELHELHRDFWNTISVTLSFYLFIK